MAALPVRSVEWWQDCAASPTPLEAIQIVSDSELPRVPSEGAKKTRIKCSVCLTPIPFLPSAQQEAFLYPSAKGSHEEASEPDSSGPARFRELSPALPRSTGARRMAMPIVRKHAPIAGPSHEISQSIGRRRGAKPDHVCATNVTPRYIQAEPGINLSAQIRLSCNPQECRIGWSGLADLSRIFSTTRFLDLRIA